MIASFARSGQWTAPTGLGARVWRGERDEHGFMNLRSLSQDGGDRSAWIQVQRAVYRQFLDQTTQASARALTWPDSDFKRALGRDLERCVLLVTLVEEQARLLMRGAPEPIRKKFLVNCQNFQDFLDKSGNLGVLAPMWMYQSQDEAGSMDRFVALCGRYRELFIAFRNCLGMNVD